MVLNTLSVSGEVHYLRYLEAEVEFLAQREVLLDIFQRHIVIFVNRQLERVWMGVIFSCCSCNGVKHEHVLLSKLAWAGSAGLDHAFVRSFVRDLS